MKIKEKGVWIVYDLEANREIQTLLQNKRFDFRFDPSLKIEKKKILAERNKEIKKVINKCKTCPYCKREIKCIQVGELKKELGI